MYATSEATYGFAKKFSHYKDFYIKHNDLYFSKLGFGTFKKEPYKEENYDFDYKEALKSAVLGGINVIDTAINYRYQQSEKEIGEVLRSLFENGEAERDELIVCSKGGFIPLDFPFPKNPYEWITEHIINKGFAAKDDIELDQHCMTTGFLKASLDKSLENLSLDCIDIYFLHNPEIQLQKLGTKRFLECLKDIFALFEDMADKGRIKSYGIAVWNAFIYDENNSEYINLQSVYDTALEAGGENHRFKYIQFPFNIAKTEGYRVRNQKMADGNYYTLLEAANKLGIGVIGSSSLLQMHLFRKSFKAEIGYLLDSDMRLKSDVELALQFVRSTRGILTSLFSSKMPSHVKNNLNIAHINAASKSKYNLLYRLSR
ncbi:MAG: aldo/keto reductase [Campylobacteraceae bacterium]|jgi:aryl-alcohol dehydrogenase-like predicted oxidoreductase|nr:aldo/keto reductase [Campylobacteraceae bacterium]